jgi:hypothetical protein
VGTQKVGGNGKHMGWSEVWVEGVDEVGNGTLTGSTYIGDSGCAAGAGASIGVGARETSAGADARGTSIGAGAGMGGG